jgi:phage terminase large subunit
MDSLGLKKDYDEIFADAAEPKSIEEIKRFGFNIKAAPKGPDSIIAGIQKLNQYKQRWTKRSINAIKEMRNYRYIENSDGKLTNKPVDNYNHAMDARRYGLFAKFGQPLPDPGVFMF